MEAAGFLPGEIFAQVQIDLALQGLLRMIGHLQRQVEAVAVSLKGKGLDEGQTLGADAGEFQGALVAVFEAQAGSGGLTQAHPAHVQGFAFPTHGQGQLVGAALPDQFLGGDLGRFRVQIAL